MIRNRHMGAEKHVQKNQKHCFIMNPRTLYKKKQNKNSSCRNEQTQHILYTDCTRGPCPLSYILHRLYTWALPLQLYSNISIVLVLAQLQGTLPEGRGGCSRCLATNLAGTSAGGNLAEMLGQPKHAASPVPGSHAGSCLKLSLQSVHLDIIVSLVSDCTTSGPSSSSPTGPSRWSRPAQLVSLA